MSDVLVSEGILSDIGDAIREKLQVENEYFVDEMADAIRAIPVGPEGVTYQETPNQFGGLDIVMEAAQYFPPPTGSIDIFENEQEKDVAAYAKANILVDQPLGEIEITENGDYDVTDYQRVGVNVPRENSPFVERYMRYTGHRYVNQQYFGDPSSQAATYQLYDEDGLTYGFPALYYASNPSAVFTDVYRLEYDHKYIVMCGAVAPVANSQWIRIAVFGPTAESYINGSRENETEIFSSQDMYGVIYSNAKVDVQNATIVNQSFPGKPFDTFVVEPFAGVTMADPYNADNPYRYLMITMLPWENGNVEFYVLDVTDQSGLYRQDTDG